MKCELSFRPAVLGARSASAATAVAFNALLATLAALSLSGCDRSPKSADASPAPAAPAVVVARVVQEDVPVFGEWIGTTAGDINAEIRPNITGYLLRRVYAEGGFVRHGDLLFEIDPRQFQAQLQQAVANLGQGEASLAKAERDVARDTPLAAERALSQQELDNAVAAEQVAKANVAALKAAVDQARLYLGWTKVTSPIGGIAGASLAQVGNLVSPQSVLATVSRVDPIRVLFNISEQEYLRYRQAGSGDSGDPTTGGGGAAGTLGADAGAAAPSASRARAGRSSPPPPSSLGGVGELELVLADGSVFPRRGRLIFTDRGVDEKTGTIEVVGLFPNPGNLLRPGQYGRVRAETGVKRGALLVPQRAVNELQGGYQVAVVGGDDRTEIRPVQAGQRFGSLWVIDQGLQPGERVVIDGFSRVKAGTLVRPKEAAEPPAASPAAAATAPASSTPSAPSAPSGH